MLAICRDREDCFFGNHPTLSELNQQCEGLGLGVIGNFLEILNSASNYKVKLSQLQILMLSSLIYEKFSYLKETELMLFFYDFFRKFSEDRFFGSIETKTIMNMLTEWVREEQGKAIFKYDRKMRKEKESKETNMNWKVYCQRNGLEESESPIREILSRLDKPKASNDTKESITNYAMSLIDNKFGFDNETMVSARRTFILRYGCTPEEYLIKKEIYE